MMAVVRKLWCRMQSSKYERKPALILINGLAEQAESWFANVEVWRRHFEVYMPQLLSYEGDSLHRRIEEKQPIDVAYLVEQLRRYLDEFVQHGPYHLVANSLGGKIAVEFAARYPDKVARLVLLCPSGLTQDERLPVVEGVRRNDVYALVHSVFHDPRRADPALLSYYQRCFNSRRWKTGLLRTVRGTMEHRVRERLSEVKQPTLLVVGEEDRIVSPAESKTAANLLPRGRLMVLPRCGHAPQIEKAKIVNRAVIDFLKERECVN